jgi:hypothetical protein
MVVRSVLRDRYFRGEEDFGRIPGLSLRVQKRSRTRERPRCPHSQPAVITDSEQTYHFVGCARIQVLRELLCRKRAAGLSSTSGSGGGLAARLIWRWLVCSKSTQHQAGRAAQYYQVQCIRHNGVRLVALPNYGIGVPTEDRTPLPPDNTRSPWRAEGFRCWRRRSPAVRRRSVRK